MTKFGVSGPGLAPELPNFCTSSVLLCAGHERQGAVSRAWEDQLFFDLPCESTHTGNQGHTKMQNAAEM